MKDLDPDSGSVIGFSKKSGYEFNECGSARLMGTINNED
jgi:hypothetical protein